MPTPTRRRRVVAPIDYVPFDLPPLTPAPTPESIFPRTCGYDEVLHPAPEPQPQHTANYRELLERAYFSDPDAIPQPTKKSMTYPEDKVPDSRLYPNAPSGPYSMRNWVESHNGKLIRGEDAAYLFPNRSASTRGNYCHKADPDLVILLQPVYGGDPESSYRAFPSECVMTVSGWAIASQVVTTHEGDVRHPEDSANCGRCQTHQFHSFPTMYDPDNNTFWCGAEAARRGFQACITCQQYQPVTSFEGGATECFRCVERSRRAVIRGHADRAAQNLQPESLEKFLFGVELEVEVYYDPDLSRDELTREHVNRRYKLAAEVQKLLTPEYVIVKHDGSLKNGFEIVTRPDSMAVHRKRWTKFLKEDKPEGLSSWRTTTCGMHVHMSREPLSRSTVGKMLVFINNPDNRAFITKIAGRVSDNYAALLAGTKITDSLKSRAECNRYTAFNINNERTVELRIFKGTLALDGFLKNLEFCAALKEWAESTPISEATQQASFLRHVIKHDREVPHLARFLGEHNLI